MEDPEVEPTTAEEIETVPESGASSASTLWPLPCTLTSLLTMNCRARAQGFAKSLQARMSLAAKREDTIPLTTMTPHGLKGFDTRSASVDEAFRGSVANESEQPLHVVTSEPSMHLLLKSPLKSTDDDLDFHYDFGLISPEGSSSNLVDQEDLSCSGKKSLTNKSTGKWFEKSTESSERPESGCVTSVTSPVMFRDEPFELSPITPPDDANYSPTDDTNLQAVREILSFTSLTGLHMMSQSYNDMNFSGIDSGLFTEADLTMDSLNFFVKGINDESDSDVWKTCEDFQQIIGAHPTPKESPEKYENISPPDGFRNASFDKEEKVLNSCTKLSRRRSFELQVKSYLQPTFRRSSPPGYRSKNIFKFEAKESAYITTNYEESTYTGRNDILCTKLNSEVVCNSSNGARADVKTRLIGSSSSSTTSTRLCSDHAPPQVQNMRQTTSGEAWSKKTNTQLSCSTNSLLGTKGASHIWHFTNPQLITTAKSVDGGQPAGWYKPVPTDKDTGGRVSVGVRKDSGVDVEDSSCEVDYTVVSGVNDRKMKDEEESASFRSFSRRRRRYKVGEGQPKSEPSSYGTEKYNEEGFNNPQSLLCSESTSEPSSPGCSYKTDDSSGPSSPTNISKELTPCLLGAPSSDVCETEALVCSEAIPPPDSWNEDKEDNSDDQEEVTIDAVNRTDEEDESIPILEGKFKNLIQYKECVKKLSDNEEERHDPSVTTVIQLDESEMSEPEEDISSHDEVSQEDLDSQLSRLEVEQPDLNVQGPSDESSRESSDDPNNEDIKMRIKRSSSLKCGKTPPGTPGNNGSKKIVRFADSLGLDLADVRTFLEGIPHVPKSAFGDLEIPSDDESFKHSSPTSKYPISTLHQPKRMLMALFQQPSALPGFIDRVRDQKVLLENVSIGEDMGIRGFVRVLNINFHKHVIIRYTFDGWRNFHEVSLYLILNNNA